MLKRALFFAVFIVLSIGLIVCLTGCGADEDEEEQQQAKLLETNPVNGGNISANGSISLTFDSAVNEVKINGISAELAGNIATWKGQNLQVGSQSFRIEWVDANGNSGSQDMTLLVESADTVPPQVKNISIKDGASDLDANELNTAGITVEFSERIDTVSSKSAIVLVQGENEISWALDWIDGDTKAVLEPGPTSKISSGSEYSLIISGYFDGAGNEGDKVEISFSTAGINVPTESLELWLKADEGVTLKGSNVSLWEDQSGNGADAEQANGVNQPILDKNAINGLPAINFDGVDDFMTFTLSIEGLTGMTIFLVSAATQDIEPPWPFCANAAIFWNETASWGTAHLTPLQSGVWMRFGTGQTQPLPVQYQYDSPIGEDFTIAVATMEGETDYLHINGELVLTNQKPAGQGAIANQRDMGNIGRGYNDNTYFPGIIAEILIYTKTLSDKERGQVEKYLSDKYSIR
jgi:hypothetical protein